MSWLDAFNRFILVYYIYSAAHYLLLAITSMWSNLQHQRLLRACSLDRVRHAVSTPPITLLVPAYNEEANVVETVRSLLALDYPELEVVVINDGSTDKTMERLRQAFGLVRTEFVMAPRIRTRPVRAVYVSPSDRALLVLDKVNGGKSDALNAGLNVAGSPYFCAVDADVVLESDALLRLASRIVLNPSQVVAVGGIVRVGNGCRVRDGRVQEARLPRSVIEGVQVIEYLRGFLFGREGWSALNALLIISGAFGCFSRELALELGGYRLDTIGEDMDLVVRMHRTLLREGRSYRILFIPDPVCWTEVPADWRTLARQRKRWQKGLLQVLWNHRALLLNPRYGRTGLLSMPYQVIVELLGPVVEMAGWTMVAVTAALGRLDPGFFLYFLIVAYLVGTVITMAAVVMEEMTYRRYQRISDVFRMLALSLIEFFPYRLFLVFCRVAGMIELFFGRKGWGRQRRIGLAEAHAPVSPFLPTSGA